MAYIALATDTPRIQGKVLSRQMDKHIDRMPSEMHKTCTVIAEMLDLYALDLPVLSLARFLERQVLQNIGLIDQELCEYINGIVAVLKMYALERSALESQSQGY